MVRKHWDRLLIVPNNGGGSRRSTIKDFLHPGSILAEGRSKGQRNRITTSIPTKIFAGRGNYEIRKIRDIQPKPILNHPDGGRGQRVKAKDQNTFLGLKPKSRGFSSQSKDRGMHPQYAEVPKSRPKVICTHTGDRETGAIRESGKQVN